MGVQGMVRASKVVVVEYSQTSSWQTPIYMMHLVPLITCLVDGKVGLTLNHDSGPEALLGSGMPKKESSARGPGDAYCISGWLRVIILLGRSQQSHG